MSSTSGASPRAVIGSLQVTVLKASGVLFESGHRFRIRLSVGGVSYSTVARKHPLAASKKPVAWDEETSFAIGLPTDFLAVTCARAAKGNKQTDTKHDTQVGALTIALAHLPQATPVTKWFELKSGGQSVAVLQLRLCYSLTYAIHRRDATSSLTIVPSQPAREFLRRELRKYARNSNVKYRFVDYFLVVGCDQPLAATTRANGPRVLERYPLVDRSDFAIPAQLECFCFPSGFSVSMQPRKPVCFSFRLNNQTELHTDQTVAAVLCFWERIIVPRTGTEGSDSSPEERDQQAESSISFSRSVDDDTDFSSVSRKSSAFTTPLQRPPPDFHASSPLTPSYRVMPAPAHVNFLPLSGGQRSRKSSPCPSPDLSTSESDDFVAIYVPRCWVLLSRVSFVPVHKDILVTLYQHFGSRADEADAQLDHAAESSESTIDPECPVCAESSAAEPKPCGMATAAFVQHQATLAAQEQERESQAVNFSNNAHNVASAVALPAQSPPAQTSSGFHRMDLTGMSSNVRAGASGDHKPDISSFGSLALPRTPVTASRRSPFAQPSPPPAQPIEPLVSRATEVVQAARASPPLPAFAFLPFSAASSAAATAASAAESAASSSHGGCCACSCCTVRVDCRGLTFEQYLVYLVDEVPLPLPGATSVELDVCCKRYRLNLPASELDFPQLEFVLDQSPLPLPPLYRSPSTFGPSVSSAPSALIQSQLGLLQILDLEVVLLLLRCILCEMKLVFHSSSVSLLHSVTESLIHLLFPFAWSHVYVPLLPVELYGMLEAPVSFIVGIESSGLARVEEMLGVGANRRAAQQNQNSELSVAARHAQTTGGELAGDRSSTHTPMPAHDLSNFAFIDIDAGVVDLAVPPPPFPPTAQKALIHNVRRLTRRDIFQHDEVDPNAQRMHRQQQRQRAADDERASTSVPSHAGSNYHMHLHLPLQADTTATEDSLLLAALPRMSPSSSPLDDPTSGRSSLDDVDSPATSTLRASASPPTSAQLLNSPNSGAATIANALPSAANPFVTSQLGSCEAAARGSSFATASSPTTVVDARRVHDRALRIEFLQFLASLIANYRDFLFFASGATPVFDTPSFLALKGRSESLPFLSRFLETQIFRDFQDRHVEFPSYLQDYLLYINSHTDACDVATDQTPRTRTFHAPLPEPLKEPQVAALIHTQTSHFLRLLATTGVTESGGAHFRHATLVISRAWSRNMPQLGVLAPGALAPDLPLKLRSRTNSIVAATAQTDSPQNLASSPTSPVALKAPARSTIFPPTRIFSLRGSGSGDDPIALGKNPSTLNHTLLFSKAWDGINSSLSEQASAAASRASTPSHASAMAAGGSMNNEVSPRELATRKAAMFGGDFVAPTSPIGNTTSIFQSAFASFGPSAMEGHAAGSQLSSATDLSLGVPPTSSASSSSSDAPRRSPLPSNLLSVSVPEAGGSPHDVLSLTTFSRTHSTPSSGNAAVARPSSRRRQMSLNLLSKAEFERKKLPANSRLGQVVALLMAPRSTGQSQLDHAASLAHQHPHVDLGELSAVGELLALPEWRGSLATLFGSDLGLDLENAPHRQLATSAFLSLSLLFNIALEECNTDGDHLTALRLLHYSAKIFNTGAEAVVNPAYSANGGARHAPQASVEREYLRSVLRRQPIWRSEDFWRVAYAHDIAHKLENPSAPHTPSSNVCTPSPSPSPSPSSPPALASAAALSNAAREAVVFESLVGLIYLQLSLSVDDDLVRACVAASCEDHQLTSSKRKELAVLVANIKRTTQATQHLRQPADAYHFTPQPTSGARATAHHRTPSASSRPTLQYPSTDADQ